MAELSDYWRGVLFSADAAEQLADAMKARGDDSGAEALREFEDLLRETIDEQQAAAKA